MKAVIIAKPVFFIDMTKDQVDLLTVLSRAHYDGVCKSASEPGGFIFGWKNSVEYNELNPDGTVTIQASFRDMDITLKILEMPNMYPHVANTMRSMSRSLHGILMEAHLKLASQSYEVNV